MTNVGCAAWSLPESGLADTLPDGMMMHVGIQTLSQMRMLRTCHVGNEQQLRQYLGCSDSRQKISAIGLNLVEDFGLNSYAGKKLRTEFFEFCLHVLHVAELLDIPAVYIPSFNKNEIVGADDLAETAKFFKELCQTAQNHPVLIATENSLSAEKQLALVEQVGEANFKVLLDIFNPLRWGHSVEEIISSVHPYLLSQVHVKDGVLPGYDNALLGQGEGNVAAIIERIKQLGFCEACILENDYSKLSMDGMNADMAFLRSCLSGTQG